MNRNAIKWTAAALLFVAVGVFRENERVFEIAGAILIAASAFVLCYFLLNRLVS